MSKLQSINELAAYCGVSNATISRVLNHKGGYSKQTEEKVLKVVEETGFVLNQSAKALKEAKSKTIGLILPNISNPFFAKLAYLIESLLFEQDYTVFVCNSANSAEKEKSYFRTLAGKNVDGIITISGLNELTDDLLFKDIPVVCLDRRPDCTAPVPSVYNDNISAAYQATNFLLERGCRNIVYMTSYTAEYQKKERYAGYTKALLEHGMAPDPAYTLERPGKTSTEIETNSLFLGFLNSGRPVDGVFTTSERSALGCMRAIKACGFRCPEDIQLITFDNTILSQMSSPTLTSVERDADALSSTACDLLLTQISGKIPEQMKVVVPTLIVAGESTLKKPAFPSEQGFCMEK